MSINQSAKINFRKLIPDFFYIIIIAISILLFLFTLNLGLQSFQTGRDLEVFCRAGQVIADGGNPYLTSELKLELSWNYPSALAYGFYIACPLFNLEQNYIWIYSILFLIGLGLWLTRQDWLYGIALCSTGLLTLGWVMITGNISTFEFLLFSLSIFLLMRKKINASLLTFGLVASLKLIPILYLPAFLLLQNTIKEKIKMTIWALAGFFFLPLLSFITSPHLFAWHLKQMLGLIPNQHNPLNEFDFLVLNQSFSVALLSLLGLESQLEKLNTIVSLIIYVLSVLILYLIIKNVSQLNKSENKLILFSLCILILTIFMPRLKPYGFLPAILCFYIISKEHSHLCKSIYLILLSIIPIVFHLIYFYTETNNKIFVFHQIIFLYLATIVLSFNLIKKYKSIS